MKRRTILWTGLGLAALATMFVVGRPMTRAFRLSERAFAPPPILTDRHIALIRNLRFAWAPLIEGGGPLVDPVAPYGPGMRLPSVQMHAQVGDALIWLLVNRALPPGPYPLQHLNSARMDAIMRAEMSGLPSERIEAAVAGLPMLPTPGEFLVTEDHTRLLAGLSWGWPSATLAPLLSRRVRLGSVSPAVDFKRPFGDATGFQLDIADLLGRPRPETAQDAAPLYALYQELWPALQTYVENIPLQPGPLTA